MEKKKSLVEKLDLLFVPSSFIRYIKKETKKRSETDQTITYDLAIIGEIGRIILYGKLLRDFL